MNYYKVLNLDGSPCHGGNGSWYLPKGNRPGKWMKPIKGDLVPCHNGYHLCRRGDLIEWLGPEIYEAEFKGEKVCGDDKVVVREARLIRKLDGWNERTARLFACDCAGHVLDIFEKNHPKDSRPRDAIAVARRFADGHATRDDLDAAWDAARDAAWDAARDAARVAAWDAAGVAARVAARAAARAATRDAAWDAAGSAAGDAERKWQESRLFEYLDGRLN